MGQSGAIAVVGNPAGVVNRPRVSRSFILQLFKPYDCHNYNDIMSVTPGTQTFCVWTCQVTRESQSQHGGGGEEQEEEAGAALCHLTAGRSHSLVWPG